MRDSDYWWLLVLPEARVTNLVVTAAGNDTLVYDSVRGELHCLNASCSQIWQALGGQRTLADICVLTGWDDDVVRQALTQLDRAQLLSTPLDDWFQVRQSRRHFLGHTAIAGAAVLPMVVSTTAVVAAQATSMCPVCEISYTHTIDLANRPNRTVLTADLQASPLLLSPPRCADSACSRCFPTTATVIQIDGDFYTFGFPGVCASLRPVTMDNLAGIMLSLLPATTVRRVQDQEPNEQVESTAVDGGPSVDVTEVALQRSEPTEGVIPTMIAPASEPVPTEPSEQFDQTDLTNTAPTEQLVT